MHRSGRSIEADPINQRLQLTGMPILKLLLESAAESKETANEGCAIERIVKACRYASLSLHPSRYRKLTTVDRYDVTVSETGIVEACHVAARVLVVHLTVILHSIRCTAWRVSFSSRPTILLRLSQFFASFILFEWIISANNQLSRILS